MVLKLWREKWKKLLFVPEEFFLMQKMTTMFISEENYLFLYSLGWFLISAFLRYKKLHILDKCPFIANFRGGHNGRQHK